MEAALRADRLIKHYPLTRSLRELARHPFTRSRRTALDGLSLEVRPGERVALIGPNGAGKTTLTRIAVGAVLPDSGTARVAGNEVGRGNAWRARVGLARPDDPSLHPRLSVLESLRFHAALYGVPVAKIGPSLDRIGAGPLGSRRIQTLSAGEKAKVSLAKALLPDPRLLLLDEISRVLDPGAAARVRTLLGEIVADGGAVLLITHDLAEASLCDRVIVLEAGRVTAEGPWTQIEPSARAVFGL